MAVVAEIKATGPHLDFQTMLVDKFRQSYIVHLAMVVKA
jgi:hypothetical protein